MMAGKNQLEKFNEIYSSLNVQQRLAVDTIEGPVMVIAGPGTGKTQILSARIGKILQETDADPRSILCLTYTDAGAAEMRNRLLSFIGAAAYRVNIHTFHSFCNEVIQDNLSFFGKLNLEPITDLEEIELFYKLIDNIDTDSPLKRFRGDNYYEKDRLKALYSLMKKEAWTPNYLNERIDAYLQELPARDGFYYKRKYKEFEAGAPNQNKILPEKERMEMLRAAVNLFPVYSLMMKAISRYTFDDMILWVLDAFANNPNMLLDYQERYQYILVDEYQDTSGSQNMLLQYLINYWDIPNVFVVGDDDQSIFSFQDANVQNIRKFEARYPEELKKIVLINNYRSTQLILNAAKALIENNQERIINDDPSLNKNLIASNLALKANNIAPEITEYPNAMHEAVGIATRIEQIVAAKNSGKDIAVIYRNHTQVEDIALMLEAKGIEVNTKRKIDLLQLPFINNIIILLQWMVKENEIPYSADDLLFRILHFDFFNITPISIAKISIAVTEKNYKRDGEKYAIRRAISEQIHHNAVDLFNQPDTSLKQTSDTLEYLLKALNNATPQHLVEMIIQKAGVLTYVMQSQEKPWLMQVLNCFFNFIKDECKRNPENSIKDLLKGIDMMRKNRITIPLYKTTAHDDGVNLVTAHGSKGLEFEYVFLTGCTSKIWDESSVGNNRNYKFPDNLHTSQSKAGILEESRRLFYVAVTRAKINLHISYPAKDKKDKDQVRSEFVTEILQGMQWAVVKKSLDENLLVDYMAIQFAETARPEIMLIEENYIGQLLNRYSLSVTHLNNFLDCPLKFYFQNLLKVPSAKSESMTFGSAVHFALQRLFEKMKLNNNLFPSKENMLEDFYWYMHRNREAFTTEEFQRRKAYGEKILPAYYNDHIIGWNKIVVIEKSIRNIEVQGVPINGKLDKIEFNGKEINVVDYKTGKYENAIKKLVEPSEETPNGGDYWRQAVFYKILLDNDKSNDWKVISTEFDFVEPVKEIYKKAQVVIKAEDVTTVTQQIKNTWQKIQKKEFKIGCGKKDCEWCKFVKTNKLAVALHQVVDEEPEV